ncbi:hypothetical protein [Nocardioides litoris]|uniref:hypothetical protein n=1 Tax=Nocardioides litoris TaxID=1926648 RepID=UPI001124ADD2|nr:hypothetical protein [Nocardioides litoris]
MRSAGLDAAALTDHATLSDSVLGEVLAGLLPPAYQQVAGTTPGDFARTGRLADAADRDGRSTAIRHPHAASPCTSPVWLAAPG